MTHTPVTFPEAWARVDAVQGWLTQAQGRLLFDEASRVAPSTVIEIGSHHGRSTIMLASAGAQVVAIDPFGAGWKYGGDGTEQRFRANIAAAGVSDHIAVRVMTSNQARADWKLPIALLYIDGKHDHWSCREDLRWAHWLPPGGRILVHDGFSSIGVTSALLRHLLVSRNHRYVDRTGSLVRLEVGAVSTRDRFRPLLELPWFVRNVVVKVLLRLNLRRATRVLGHHDAADPY